MTARTVLAFDCAGRALSVALGRGGGLLAARREERLRGHGERLFGLIEELLAETGLDYPDIDLIAVTRGPGSFTGLRIGLAAARGLALARGRPVFAATTFELAMAGVRSAQRLNRHIVALIDSKRQELFVQIQAASLDPADRQTAATPFAAAPEQLHDLLPPGQLLLCGDGAVAALEPLRSRGRDVQAPPETARLDARWLLPLAAAADLDRLPTVQPLYLRPPDVTLPKLRDTANGGEGGPGADK
ncbi:tRNA (adenosine(37)-N6)-threonylcarbamoyltransferase complex dimerization subunit type 1 TsaB [Algihabitans albus]|uniref:tRNA (adenosine(37)-N6)-threonylcarbamoyltransferase complex dimerization subunit type 1 TsaB n=1 Tax=Algihabitans albus TaxID=2164067 RepID=UPI000E5D7F6C|nr:tRNA (adenosine(37)-N6)-threonylcarbamoyltransferase complex dimerization subunit type 1 TsaB [Algihabitans albus]